MKESKNNQGKKLTKTRSVAIIIASIIVVVGGIVAAVVIYNNIQNGCPENYHLGGGSLPNSEHTCFKDRDPSERPLIMKPIIYLYPTEETAVNVRLSKPELLTTTYPKYDSDTGWNVVAKPNGDLTYISKSKLDSSSNGKRLYSLYWEGKNKPASIKKDGYVVKGSDTASFLEDKLARLGLSDREAEEFIIYWLPKLEHNDFNYIRFETKDEINSYMPLDISPKPDTIIRVAMDWKKLGNDEARQIRQNIREQQLPATPARTGFTVVEWGGSEIK